MDEETNLHETMDANKWAKEFMRIWGTRLTEIDESLMLAWFSNSIMCGFDHANYLSRPVIDKLKALLLLTDPAVSNEEMNALSSKQFNAFEEWEKIGSFL